MRIKLNIPKNIVANTFLKIIATTTAINAAYNLLFSSKNNSIPLYIDKLFIIIGIKTTIGIYFSVFLINGDNSFGIIPDKGINLVIKVIRPHKIIVVQIIIFYQT